MAARRTATSSSERTAAFTILAVGTLAALASLLGGVWVLRAGVVVAIMMAFAAVWLSMLELRRERREHHEELRRQIDMRLSESDRHHAESLAMIERFSARTDNLKRVAGSLRRQLAAANSELSTLRGNAVWLRGEVSSRQARIDELCSEVESLATQVREMTAANDENVVDLPRHGVAAKLDPDASELWGDDEQPTMVDISMVNFDAAPEQLRKHA
ncbi:MAG: hypothetical protein ACK5KO_12870 [Arachnia sp.]